MGLVLREEDKREVDNRHIHVNRQRIKNKTVRLTKGDRDREREGVKA